MHISESGIFHINTFAVEWLAYRAERRSLKKQRIILSFQKIKSSSISDHNYMCFQKIDASLNSGGTRDYKNPKGFLSMEVYQMCCFRPGRNDRWKANGERLGKGLDLGQQSYQTPEIYFLSPFSYEVRKTFTFPVNPCKMQIKHNVGCRQTPDLSI